MSSESGILSHPFSQFVYYSVLCTIPFYYWRQITPVVPLDWYITLVLVAILGIYLMSGKHMPPLFSNNLNKWFLLFFFVNVMSSLISPYPADAWDGLVVLIQVYVFVFINLSFITEKGLFGKLPLILAMATGLNGAIAGLDYFLGINPFYESEYTRAAYGLTTGANNLSLMSVFVIPPMVQKILNARSPMAFFFYLGLVLCNVMGLISSESRGGFLIFFVMGILLLISNRHRFHPRLFGLAVSGVGVMMLVGVAAIPDTYVSRQKTLLSDRPDVSFQRRAAYIRVALRSFSDNPILGTGTNSFPQVWLASPETMFFELQERGAHNTYLDILVGVGILGLLTFFGLLFRIFRDFLTAINNYDLLGNELKRDMTSAYLVSFLTVCAYCLLKTLVDHKFFILIMSISQVVFFLSQQEMEDAYGRD
ncbi:MAG: O-antigen ligase family protein [Desulfobacterales bacterium]|nr:O-antigen ligase family protein [Desulfobacterales bacterium]